MLGMAVILCAKAFRRNSINVHIQPFASCGCANCFCNQSMCILRYKLLCYLIHMLYHYFPFSFILPPIQKALFAVILRID